MATAVLDFNASGPGTDGRPEKEAESGDGRLGEEEKAMGDRPNPGEGAPSPADGGPKGSRMGEDECRWWVPELAVEGGD